MQKRKSIVSKSCKLCLFVCLFVPQNKLSRLVFCTEKKIMGLVFCTEKKLMEKTKHKQ